MHSLDCLRCPSLRPHCNHHQSIFNNKDKWPPRWRTPSCTGSRSIAPAATSTPLPPPPPRHRPLAFLAMLMAVVVAPSRVLMVVRLMAVQRQCCLQRRWMACSRSFARWFVCSILLRVAVREKGDEEADAHTNDR